jgi:hypothetical protein
MLKVVYQIWKDFWVFLNGLSSKTIAIVCVGGSVIGCLAFVNFMLYDHQTNNDIAPIMAELTALRAEYAQSDSIIMREIRAIAEQVDGVDTKVTKVILIVAANSNSDLIRRLVPYLENVATKQDIYSFVLDIQRDQQQRNQQQRDSSKRDSTNYSISVEKKTKTNNP